MKLRGKFVIINFLVFSGMLVVVLLSLRIQFQLQALSGAMKEGQALLEQTRKIRHLTKDAMIGAFAPEAYGNLKDILYFQPYHTTLREWKEATRDFQQLFYSFMRHPLLLQVVQERKLRDEYDTAEVMFHKALAKLEGLQQRLQRIQNSSLWGEDLYIKIQISSDPDVIALFDEARQTSYYLVNSFESYFNYFIETLETEGDRVRAGMMYTFLGLSLVMALITTGIPLVFSSRIVFRLTSLSKALSRLSEGDFSTPLSFNVQDEFQTLAHQFNGYTALLQENLRSLVFLARGLLENRHEYGELQSLDPVLAGVVDRCVQLFPAEGGLLISKDGESFFGGIREKGVEKKPFISWRNLPFPLSEHLQMRFQAAIKEARRTYPAIISDGDSQQGFWLAGHLLVEEQSGGFLLLYRSSGPFNDLEIIRFENYLDFASLFLAHVIMSMELMEKRNAEYQSLQAQVQPHFLYNVLNSFVALNQMGEREELEKSLLALKTLLRYTVDHRKESTLAEELDFIERYLELQKLRFQHRLRWTIDVDPEAGLVHIPKLLLHPLVENALIHGIEPKEEGGTVTIQIEKPGEEPNRTLRIIIHDTGVGFDPLTTAEGIGLQNVRKRLELWYSSPRSPMPQFSKDYLRIESYPGGGTTITLIMPVIS
ncbi:MAG TPA: histidine kinase [Termitinemataceae bacterium]|nr:histidine kinase [Termitinemataceae bacterium]HOM24246.1 histidine kinase [Termitinemataceae bacterium]HPQ01327.1 histidine kinase [Termitinemataceae bacterium]